MFLEFLETGKVDYQGKINFDFSIMVPGICDLTGEILRKAVMSVTKGEKDKVVDHKNAVEEIVGELMKFDLTGKMRHKFDEAKRNLKRLEEVARGQENTMPLFIECVEAYATLGEICDVLRGVFGEQKEFLVV